MNPPATHSSSTGHPRWMTYVLLAAGIYNLIWGGWVVLRPMDLFDATGIERPLYPGIWQCVGMIVGVYGIGYAIAARDPFRHWPIVLVGFLGKTFGPIGMLFQLMIPEGTPGRLPLEWAWVNVTNDLIWWGPFAAILYQSFRTWNQPKVENRNDTYGELNEAFESQRGESIASLSQSHAVLVVFLRHGGCTFCREALDDLSKQRQQIEALGAEIVVVHMSDNDASKTFFDEYDLCDVHRISDPECRLYRAYDLERGRVSQLFGLSVFWRGFLCAIINRHGVGKLEGDGFQMPGAFLVRDNKIITAYRHQTAASRPDYCAVAGSSSSTGAMASASTS